MAERDPFLATLLAQDPRVDTRQPRWTSAGLYLSLSLDRKRNKAATVVVVLRRYNAAVSPSDICHFT